MWIRSWIFFLSAIFLITEVEVKNDTTTYTQRNKTRMSYNKEFKKFADKRRDKARLILASITQKIQFCIRENKIDT